MEVAVVGTGYVGLVAGACFADSGNNVICVDIDEKKVERLIAGEIPIYEPGLADIVHRNARSGRLSFTTSLKEGVEKSEIIFIAVGTPQDEDGSADLTHVLAVARGIGEHMNGPKIVVDKSTVPVGTAAKVTAEIEKLTDHTFEVVSNPEFLKEGAAIDDFMKPDRVVVGVSSEHAAERMKELYAPFVRTNKPILVMDVLSAEMTKYAANAMLATRISFMNEVSNLCDRFPGIGYGGSCFPKDVQALIRTAKEYDINLQIGEAVESVNFDQKRVLVDKVIEYYGGAGKLAGKTFAIWGLAFKPQTDDTREAPALVICEELLKHGVKLQAFDPEAKESFRERFGDHERMIYTESDYDALKGADALLVCTEWNSFRRPSFDRVAELLAQKVVFDGRNIFSPKTLEAKGFVYHSIGRPAVGVK
jgi:UDPglucose 6-dehydrogenase